MRASRHSRKSGSSYQPDDCQAIAGGDRLQIRPCEISYDVSVRRLHAAFLDLCLATRRRLESDEILHCSAPPAPCRSAWTPLGRVSLHSSQYAHDTSRWRARSGSRGREPHPPTCRCGAGRVDVCGCRHARRRAPVVVRRRHRHQADGACIGADRVQRTHRLHRPVERRRFERSEAVRSHHRDRCRCWRSSSRSEGPRAGAATRRHRADARVGQRQSARRRRAGERCLENRRQHRSGRDCRIRPHAWRTVPCEGGGQWLRADDGRQACVLRGRDRVHSGDQGAARHRRRVHADESAEWTHDSGSGRRLRAQFPAQGCVPVSLRPGIHRSPRWSWRRQRRR